MSAPNKKSWLKGSRLLRFAIVNWGTIVLVLTAVGAGILAYFVVVLPPQQVPYP